MLRQPRTTRLSLILICTATLATRLGAQPQPLTMDLDTDLNGINGVTISGGVGGGRVGEYLQGIGDVNGDGWNDFAVGMAGTTRDAGTQDGEVFVVFGTGERFAQGLNLDGFANGTRGFRLINTERKSGLVNSQLGKVVGALGDIDGDGYDDFFVGDSSAVLGPSEIGFPLSNVSYIVFGREQFAAEISLTPAFDELPGIRRIRGASFQTWGHAASGVGDFDGDGREDWVLNGRFLSAEAREAAATTVLIYGAAARPAEPFQPTTAPEEVVLRLPGSVKAVGLGDVDGDGHDDLAVSAGLGPGPGRVYFGQSRAVTTPHRVFEINLTGESSQGVPGSAGADMNPIGDMNGDGFRDFMVGSGSFGSEFYVVYGSADLPGQSVNMSEFVTGTSSTRGFRISNSGGTRAPRPLFAGLGDFNGDGFGDFFLNFAFSPGDGSGQYWISMLRGRTAPLPNPLSFFNDSLNFGQRFRGSFNNGFTANASLAGDLDGDGLSDMIAGATTVTNGSFANAGQVYVIYGYDRRFSVGVSPATAVATDRIRAGNAPDRAVGALRDGRTRDGSPRLWIDYPNGEAITGGPSFVTVTLTRNALEVSNLGAGPSDVAPVMWRLQSNRSNIAGTVITLRYRPTEVAGIGVGAAGVYLANNPAGPWTRAEGEVWQPAQRKVSFPAPNDNVYIAISRGGTTTTDIRGGILGSVAPNPALDTNGDSVIDAADFVFTQKSE